MSIGRLKEMSAIVVTGGVMEAHPLPEEYTVQDPACAINELLTLEQIGKFDAWEKTGVISGQQLRYYKHNACPSCGACSFMGTASTMQIMAEALGSWVNATGCTFRGNDVGLWLDNRGGATCSGSYYGDSVYEDNGTAVRIAAMPGTETLDFNNCVFRGNRVNVENTAGYAVDLSQIVTADN